MTTLIEAAQQALEALENALKNPVWRVQCNNAMIALRQAIEQAQKQEPVGWIDDGGKVFWKHLPPEDGADLYAYPPRLQPLTEEEIKKAAPTYAVDDFLDFNAGVRFAEAAHGITGENNGTR